MAGRGRGFILPAWKVQQQAQQSTPGPVGSAPNTNNQNALQPLPTQGQPPQMQPPPQQLAPLSRPPSGQPPPIGMPPQTRPPPQVAPAPVQRGPWTEHRAPDGKPYYHNVVTNQTTYEKPDVFKTEIERQLPKPLWKEYIKNGKSYYFNAETNQSVWEEPMAFTQYKARLEAMCTGEVPTKDAASLALFNAAKQALEACVVDSDGTGALKKEKEKKAALENAAKSENAQRVKAASELELKKVSGDLRAPTKDAVEYKSIEEAMEAFKKMLEDRKVPAKATWAEAMMKGIANDKRFKALKGLKQRKKALEEYSEWKRDKEERELRKAEKESEEGLKSLLKRLSTVSEPTEKAKVNGRMRLGDVIALLEDKQEYKAVTDSRFREKIIRSFLDELFESEKRERLERERMLKKRAMLALEELYKAEKISIDTEFGSGLRQVLTETKDERILAVDEQNLEDLWRDFISDVREKERRAKQEAERKRRQELKDAKLDFYNWLNKSLRDGKLSLEKEFAPDKDGKDSEKKDGKFYLINDINEEEVYKKLVALDESAPTKEYNYLIKKIDQDVDDCRHILKKIFKKSKIRVEVDSKFDSLKAAVAEFYKANPGDKKSIEKLLDESSSSRSRSKSRDREDKKKEGSGEKDLFESLQKKFSLGIIQAGFEEIVREAKKKIKRKKKDFEALLYDTIYKSEHVGMTWEVAKSKISGEDEYEALKTEEVRIQVFQEYMKKFNARKEKKRLAASAKEKDANPSKDAPNEEEDGEIRDEGSPGGSKRKRPPGETESSKNKKEKKNDS